ncbi:hypothetical protein [Pseudomonas frederiksbergensis]|uniref:hypothetical protein n=1 Tax=Pseudomonas frederiksbergensis TaxID=104087 RepID=UPI001EF7C266|nr:hypothetical protein [Pseudomonas frederiksbergensis]
MATRNAKARRKSPPFAMIQKRMIQSVGFRALGPWSRAVILELLAQYNGQNNGDLSATRTMAKEWGIGSAHTLQRALEELEAGGWIMQSRTSVFGRQGARCALYALSWLPIDECPGKNLDIQWTHAPPRPMPTLLGSNSTGA